MVRPGVVACVLLVPAFAACSEVAAPPDPLAASSPVSITRTFSGSLGIANPCNGEFVQGSTTITLSVHRVLSSSGNANVVVTRSVTGTALGSLGNSYVHRSDAKQTFKTIAGSYEVPYYATMVTVGKLSFGVFGVVSVGVDALGAPTGSLTLSLDTKCLA